ncbi:MAG TPA: energy-coupling factor transporter ATPase [Methanoregulaceae archaeon]|nr:energy-coupling factor transporter ATPase [Methanoregulaceae archaeon]HQJ88361.1 energy-coupling factor transporter ATPase [Methanoregulaceae archaeon]
MIIWIPAMLVVENLSFTYPGTDQPAVDSVSFSVRDGEFVILTGPSGCGKSTLAALVKGLIREGATGSIRIDGVPADTLSVPERAQRVGMVFQNPDLQFFGVTVREDVAFGPENLGLPRDEIRARVEVALRAVGIADLADRVIVTLSGGERQRVAIAGALAMRPRLLILDEPTSDLDPGGRREVLETLRELQGQGITILLIEHNLEEVAEYADRCLVMEEGRLVADDTPFGALSEPSGRLTAIGVHPPQRYWLAGMLGLEDASDGALLGALGTARPPPAPPEGPLPGQSGTAVIEFDHVTTVRDGRKTVLDDVTFRIRPGEFVALIGRNGAGKSTIAGHLIGFLRATNGRVLVDGEDAGTRTVAHLARRIGYLFQNPDNQLFMDSVSREIGFGLVNYGISDVEGRVRRAMEHHGLVEFASRPPQSLSRGQRQRVAVASILAMEPGILVLDEPTTGQDRGHLHALMEEMVGLHRAGRAVLLITHDLTLVAAYAERVLVLDRGRLLFDGTPTDLFYGSSLIEALGWPVPTAIRLGRALGLRGVMTPQDLLAAVPADSPGPGGDRDGGEPPPWFSALPGGTGGTPVGVL